MIERLITTDTLPQDEQRPLPLQVISVAPLLAEAVTRLHDGRSMTGLLAHEGEAAEVHEHAETISNAEHAKHAEVFERRPCDLSDLCVEIRLRVLDFLRALYSGSAGSIRRTAPSVSSLPAFRISVNTYRNPSGPCRTSRKRTPSWLSMEMGRPMTFPSLLIRSS